jgi:hypothetical protein
MRRGLLGRQRGRHEAAVTVVDLAHAHQLAAGLQLDVRPTGGENNLDAPCCGGPAGVAP